MTTKETPDAPAKKEVLKVNDPLSLGGTSIYLTGNGYAPVVTVRDGAGNVAMQGPVVAKLQGENYYSSVVIKVPDAKPDQLAFAGFFLPTAFVTDEGVSFSGDPELINPQLTPELLLRRPRPERRRPAERLRARREEADAAQCPEPGHQGHHPRRRAPPTRCRTARAPSASTA